MKKWIILFVFSLICNYALAANTFFLYVEENCDDKKVAIAESAREGILDIIYDAGYIIFDDVSAKKTEISDLINQTSSYGASFLIVTTITSNQTIFKEKLISVASKAQYTLYDLKNKSAVNSGKIEREINFEKSPMSRSQFWYNLGADIGKEITDMYTQYTR